MKSFWKISAFVATVALLSTVIFLVSCSKSDSSSSNNAAAQWTIMMYGAGNNNLDVSNNNTSFIIQDAQDMEKVGSQSGMNIIAMIASQRTGGVAKYYKIEQHTTENPDQLSSTMLRDLGARDMSDSTTLKNFLNFCKENYPANHYLLIIDDHGAGWPGSCSDELNGGGGLLSMRDLRDAIANSNIHHVDILTFHACLMAMVEVGYELRSVVDYMTASQITMPMQNILGADLWLAWLKDNMSCQPRDLAQKIAEKVIVAAQNKQKTAHYAMVNLSQMQSLGAQIGTLGNILVTEGNQHWNEVQDAWGNTHTSVQDKATNVDLREFANKVTLEPTLSTINLIRDAAQNVISGINNAVVYTSTNSLSIPRGGLCIHFPSQLQDFDSANYVALDFRQTHWQDFLSAFLRSGVQPPTGRCCYGNNQCGVGTQAECAGVSGTWTQGADCSGANPCGGGTVTGRCCYGNNQCGVSTQAECAGVSGTWTQGADCSGANPCGGGGTTCPTVCNSAQQLQVGVATQCSFSGTDSVGWFYVNLPVGYFRFTLCGFNYPPNDNDLYIVNDCTNRQPIAQSTNYGCEDTTWQVTGAGAFILAVQRWTGSGGYTIQVSQVSATQNSAILNPNRPESGLSESQSRSSKPKRSF